MSEPEVRCPQCAATVPAGATRCERCGAAVPAATAEGIETWFSGPEAPPWVEPTRPADMPPTLPPEGVQTPPLPPPPGGEVLILEESVEPPPVARVREPEPPEVPVVRPTVRRAQRLDDLPEAQPLPPYRRTLPGARPAPPDARPGPPVRPPLPPVRDGDAPPRPRILLAMLVLLAMAIAFACGLSVIIYAIYAGLKASRPGRSEALPVRVEPLDRGPSRPLCFTA